MSFKFSEIEGLDPELAATLDADTTVQTAITGHITSSVDNRVEVVKSDFKAKMDSLDAKRLAAEEKAKAFAGVNPDELEALRQARDKNPELQATLDAIKQKAEASERALAEQTVTLQKMQMRHTISQAINEYDVAFPTVSVKPDMKDVVSMLASDALRYDEDAKTFRVYNAQGEIVATDKGAATPVDWLVKLRDERPSLFNVPAGSGAPGSRSNGSAEKIISRAEFDRLPPEKRGQVATTHQITD